MNEKASSFENINFPFSIYKKHILPKTEMSLAQMDYVMLIYVAEGKGQYFVNGYLYPLSKGQIFIIEKNVTHGFRSSADSPLTIYSVNFLPHLLAGELEALSQITDFINFFYADPFFQSTTHTCSKLVLCPKRQIEIVLLLEQLLEEYHHKQLAYELMIQTKFKNLLIVLIRSYNEVNNKCMTLPNDENILLNRVCEFIKIYFAKPISLQQISEMCGMGLSTFTSKFKEAYGISFIEYRNQIRISAAKHLLESTNLKIIAIANEVGFEDLSNFNKAFKKQTGFSPRQYREYARKIETKKDC